MSQGDIDTKGGAGVVRIFYSVREVAAAVGISERTAWSLVKSGAIPSVRLMGRRLVPVEGLKRWSDALVASQGGANG